MSKKRTNDTSKLNPLATAATQITISNSQTPKMSLNQSPQIPSIVQDGYKIIQGQGKINVGGGLRGR